MSSSIIGPNVSEKSATDVCLLLSNHACSKYKIGLRPIREKLYLNSYRGLVKGGGKEIIRAHKYVKFTCKAIKKGAPLPPTTLPRISLRFFRDCFCPGTCSTHTHKLVNTGKLVGSSHCLLFCFVYFRKHRLICFVHVWQTGSFSSNWGTLLFH